MNATFRYALRNYRFSLIGWGIGLFVLALMVAYLYVSFVEEQAEQLEELLESLPKALQSFAKLDDVLSPKGFLDVRFFAVIPLLLGIYAALAGSALLVQDEEAGRMDLILAHPVSRRSVFLGRLAAFVVVLVGILCCGWLGLAVGVHWTSMPISVWALIPAFLSLLAVILLVACLGLLFSMLLPARRYAGTAGITVLVASFFLTGFARVDPSLKPLASLLPLQYYQGADAMSDFSLLEFFGLLGAAGVAAGLAYWRFEARDIRVEGEGTMSKPGLIVGVAVVVLIFAVPVGVAMIPPTYDTPEDAFTVATEALQNEDWETFASVLTPESKDEWNSVLLVYGSIGHTRGAGLMPKPGALPDDVSMDKMMVLFGMMGKFRSAMKHVDTDALDAHQATIQKTLLSTMFSQKPPTVDDKLLALAKLVKDRNKFLVKGMRAWSVAFGYSEPMRLENVRVAGDRATGELVVGNERKEIRFEKVEGSWRVGLPFLAGERREVTAKP